jgi:signal peptidase II
MPKMLKNNIVRKKLIIVGAVVALILLLDQLIKIWVKTSVSTMDQPINLLGDWFKIVYVENQGMAFGTTFGAGIWGKLALSIFRIIAIGGIGYYWFKQAKAGMKMEFLVAIGFIFAGATGNLIDSMFYDFIFPFKPCMSFNQLEGSGVFANCDFYGKVEVRHAGFLLGNVVDMFQFDFTWPSWIPWLGGKDVFPAVWNVADGAITCGVVLILIRQRSYFPKKKKKSTVFEDISENVEEKNETEVIS